MTIAVFGARGFIGGRLTSALTRGGHDVVAISSAEAFDAASGLLRPPPFAGRLDSVVYLSQSPRYRDLPQQSAHVWGVNVMSALMAAEWARHCGASQFIYASTGTVYSPSFAAHRESDPVRRDGGYALSKIHAEEALHQFAGQMRIALARCFSVYGPRQRDKLIPNLIARIQSGAAVDLQPRPRQPDDRDGVRLSLIHVDDAVRVFVRLIESGCSGPINVASDQVLSIRAIADTIGAGLGTAPRYTTAAAPREGDVIADTSRLSAILDGPYKTFQSSIGEVISAAMTVMPE